MKLYHGIKTTLTSLIEKNKENDEELLKFLKEGGLLIFGEERDFRYYEPYTVTSKIFFDRPCYHLLECDSLEKFSQTISLSIAMDYEFLLAPKLIQESKRYICKSQNDGWVHGYMFIGSINIEDGQLEEVKKKFHLEDSETTVLMILELNDN